VARRIRLDHKGLRAVLTSPEVAAAVHALAEQTADALRDDDAIVRHSADVEVDDYTTDRAASAVTIKHPGGRGIEAKHGSLTRAAGAAGLEVRDRTQ
jgi:hypothetical protein